MIEPLLKSQLEPMARRRRRLNLWKALTLLWAFLSLGVLSAWGGLWLVDRFSGWHTSLSSVIPSEAPWVAVVALIAGFWTWQREKKWEPDFHKIAVEIEEKNPSLHALLRTAVEQQAETPGGTLNYLQERVVREAVAESFKSNWVESVSERKVFGWQLVHAASLLALILILIQMNFFSRHGGSLPNRGALAGGMSVSPGDTSIEKGNSLVVLARFDSRPPAEVALVLIDPANNERRLPLSKNLDDPVFGGSVPEVATDFKYRVVYGAKKTRDYKVSVFEHPRLERADAQVHYPPYTGLGEKRIEDTHRISAVEGSRVDFSLQLNKPVVSARLLGKDKSILTLVTTPHRASAILTNLELVTSQSYGLQLVDSDGRTNKVPAQFVFDVLKNRTPELKILSPRGDQRVSALQEIRFQGEVWDDFGVKAYGLSYSVPGGQTKIIALNPGASTTNLSREKQAFSYLLKLEELGVAPDDLVSYFVWADDIGPDGKIRRTSSDMYFAEIRPFEEIFRQSQSGGGESSGEQQQGNQSTKLAELQKQIINATWKLQRQEAGPKASAQYLKDAPVVRDSQQDASEQAKALKTRAADARTQGLVDMVRQEMERALQHLNEAVTATKPLPEALAAEQAAYQALLKIQSREYEIAQSRNSKGKGAGQQQNQRQLDELELKVSENRYETQKQATPQQSAEQKEQLQLLNRLKELAQRQQDLNERLKEMQTALQEAKTDQEREEVRRQLKRLREQEREMLADVDEMKQKMQQSPNQSQLADARKQLDQTRNEMQKASEALEKDSVAQALSSGTRAERELKELRDEFRKKNSSEFAEEMKQLRDQARQLSQKEEEIGRKLDAMANPKQKTLTDSTDKKELAASLDQQRDRLTNLLDQATQMTEKAEAAEPLLSKQLYDTIRKSSQDNASSLKEFTDELAKNRRLSEPVYDLLETAKKSDKKTVDVTAELLRKGFIPEATALEQRARKGIDDLKRGVERAAEAVLGDETESLRLARRELDELSRQLENEISQGQAPGEKASAEKEQDPNSSKPGQSADGKKPGAPGQGDEKQLAQNQAGGQGQKGEPGNAPSESKNDSPDPNGKGQGQGQGGQRAGGQNPGGQSPQDSQAQAAQGQGGQRGSAGRQARGGAAGGRNGGGGFAGGNLDNFLNGTDRSNPVGAGGPIMGPDFGNWSDRLGNVEEMIDQPDLQNQLSKIRESARLMRLDYKRNLKKPDWAVVRTQIGNPLAEVRNRVNQELARRESSEALAPIDRDPVPARFSELVRRYYETLGKSD